MRQSLENAGLSDFCVAQDHNFEEHIKVVHHAKMAHVVLRHSCWQIGYLCMQGWIYPVH